VSSIPSASSSSAANLRGILAMVVAVGAFSMMDASMKSLTSSYPPLQVACLRGLAAMPLVCLYVLWRREWGGLLKVRWPLHLLRTVVGVTMLSSFVYGLRTLGLAEAYAIFFVAPMLITMLSIPVLKERVRSSHWLAIAGGFCGVLVALRPSQGAFLSWGALAVLVSASCYAISAITGRILSRTDSSASLVFWGTSGLAVAGGVLAWPDWVAVQSAHIPQLVVIGISGFIGQLAITQAFRSGQASVVAPFEYTALAWGILLDGLLWQILPQASTLLGGAIIIASGLYLIRHERVKELVVAP
jgi:drug/metabolite transporter (DMT)-like permease